MQQYLDLLKTIRREGFLKEPSRSNMPETISYFGYNFRHDFTEGYPLLTTKRVFFKGVVIELLWFIHGYTNVRYLNKHGVYFWNEDAYRYYLKIRESSGENIYSFEEFSYILKSTPYKDLPVYGDYRLGDCGKQYGWLWRNYEGVDQLANLIEGLINSPSSRRHIIDAWNPPTLNQMALPACHTFVQFNTRPLASHIREFVDRGTASAPKYFLDCHMYQRSGDAFLGVPLNIASYALLTYILCIICDMLPGTIIYSYGDVHIYKTHEEAVNTQLERSPRKLPTIQFSRNFFKKASHYRRGKLSLNELLNSLSEQDITLVGYNPYNRISAPLSTGL